jgi:hypothetical protein
VKHRFAMLAVLAALAACSKKEPETTSSPAIDEATRIAEDVKAQVEAQTGAPVTNMTVMIDFVDPPDDVFVDMTIAAAGWAKSSIASRTIGVYQAEGASEPFRLAVEAVTRRYAFRPIGPSDYQVVCGGNAPSQTSITTRTAKCSMKYVDAVLAFNTVRMTRDSGYVGLNITRVPNGANRAERVHHCITLIRKGAEWEAKRSERMVDARRCPRRIP